MPKEKVRYFLKEEMSEFLQYTEPILSELCVTKEMQEAMRLDQMLAARVVTEIKEGAVFVQHFDAELVIYHKHGLTTVSVKKTEQMFVEIEERDVPHVTVVKVQFPDRYSANLLIQREGEDAPSLVIEAREADEKTQTTKAHVLAVADIFRMWKNAGSTSLPRYES